ncbi:hypothetical protein [Rhodopseudomonas palustris]|uniref:hypothetical protein n=1 Tax=Rhodopseudomonas palustris TaxID=1076 RepID=UPI0012ED61D2
MGVRKIDKDHIAHDEDWFGNNAAFSCPLCRKVFFVSGHLHPEGKRICPRCEDSTGYVVGGKDSGGSARIEWPNSKIS